jgi:hypothetical protein
MTQRLTSKLGAERIALALIGLFMLPAAAQASFFPRSFYDDFPMGRAWIAVDGEYNEHLVRDVGGLFLGLIVVTAFAMRRRELLVPIATAWLVSGSLHLWYHVGHLDAYDGVDKIGLIASLGVVPIAAAAALLFANRGGSSGSGGSDADQRP